MASTTTANPYSLDRRIAETLADMPNLVAQAQRAADLIRTGQLDTRYLTTDTWGTLLDSLRAMVQYRPTDDWSAALDRYVRPLLGSNAPASLQGKAADVLATIATSGGRLDPQLLYWIQAGPSTQSLFQQRAQTLNALMQAMPKNPDVRAAYTTFMTRYAPAGTLTSAAYGPQGAAELIQLYQTALQQIAPEDWGNLPRLQLPESVRNLPLAWQRVAQEMAEGLLNLHGQVVTPTGFAFSPEIQANDILGASGYVFPQMLSEALARSLTNAFQPAPAASSGYDGTQAPAQAPTIPAPAALQTGNRGGAPAFAAFLDRIRQALAGPRQVGESEEQMFQQQIRPVLDQMVQQAGSRRAVFDYFNGLSWQDQIRLFGSAAMANRVRQYLATGR